jgi:hypothetical protein
MRLMVTGGQVGVISVKDTEIEVPGQLTGLSGIFKFENSKEMTGLTGSLDLDLSTWDSDLPERDKNIKSHFFDIPGAGTAVFSLTEVIGLPEEPLAVGHSAEVVARGWLKMNGAEVAVEPKVKLSRAGDREFHIDSVEPFFVSVESLGMTNRLKKLISVCNHQSIDDNMKISLRLSLGPAGAGKGKAKVGRRSTKLKAKTRSGKATRNPTRDNPTRDNPTRKGNNNSLNPSKGGR